MLFIDILTDYEIIYYSTVLVIRTINITRRPCMTNHYLVKYYDRNYSTIQRPTKPVQYS